MRSNEIKMAYYGILMKDGTELTHYGVKGMKWGKRLFGTVKGIFGKPDKEKEMFPHARERERRQRENDIANKSTNRSGMGLALNIKGGINSRSNAENDRLIKQWVADDYNTYYKRNGWALGVKQQNNTKKRYSTRLNGR